ncbi:hypothetical protein QZH41_003107 [Actinostola sp. cb2023]|nr:hypothetical protein QZH41_003107 [Actinostola sp. cb2023]
MNNTTDGEQGESYSLVEVTAWSIAFGIESLLVICGNILTISTFVGTKRLRRHSAILLINLAIADLCVGGLSIPLFIYVFVDYYWFGRSNLIIHYMHRFIDAGTAHASLFSLVLVSLERVRVIVWPLQHRMQTKKIIFMSIAMSWILAFILPALQYTDTKTPVSFYVGVPMITISLIIMCIAYVIIWIQVRYKRQKSHRSKSSEFERAFALTLFIVTITSVCAWLPYQAILIIETLCRRACGSVSNNAFYTSKLLHYGNSLINPVIYSLRFPEFKKAAFRILSARHSGGSGKHNANVNVPLQEMLPSPNQTANTSVRWTWKSRSARGSTKSNGSPRLQVKELKKREDLEDLVERS